MASVRSCLCAVATSCDILERSIASRSLWCLWVSNFIIINIIFEVIFGTVFGRVSEGANVGATEVANKYSTGPLVLLTDKKERDGGPG